MDVGYVHLSHPDIYSRDCFSTLGVPRNGPERLREVHSRSIRLDCLKSKFRASNVKNGRSARPTGACIAAGAIWFYRRPYMVRKLDFLLW